MSGLKKVLTDARDTQAVVNDTVRRLVNRLQRDFVKLENRTTLSKENSLDILEAITTHTLARLRTGRTLRQGAVPWLKIHIESNPDAPSD